MKNPFALSQSRIDKIFFVALALLLNIFFFLFNQKTFFFTGLLAPHAEIAFNLYNNNSIKVNPERIQNFATLCNEKEQLVTYEEFNTSTVSDDTEYRSVNDTIGYGILLGLLWKLTNKLTYQNMQMLQMLLFSLLMILIYESAMLLFHQRQIALFVCGAFLCYFPLIFLNVQVMRDIWGYYGLAVIFYSIIAAYHNSLSLNKGIFYSLFFALCQWMRPTIFFTLIPITLALLFFRKKSSKPIYIISLFWLLNALAFWIPFIAYNKTAYNRYLVSPAGQDLIEGLGEYKNPWGFIMDDEWFASYMQKNYQLKQGTIEINDKAHELFIKAIQKHPFSYISMILKRIPLLFFFNPLWTNNVDHLLDHCHSLRERIFYCLSHPLSLLMKCIDYAIAKLHYIEFFLLLGWLGIFLAWQNRHHSAVVFALCIAFSCISKLPSHMEARYLIIFYWVFAFFVGYALNFLYVKIKNLYRNYQAIKSISRILLP